jgi:hypothetical protein
MFRVRSIQAGNRQTSPKSRCSRAQRDGRCLAKVTKGHEESRIAEPSELKGLMHDFDFVIFVHFAVTI